MNRDTTDFLTTLLFDGDSSDLEYRPLYGKTVHDFSDEFVAAVERYVEAFRTYVSTTGFNMEKLARAERSFGGNVYWSLSGAGVGFFDDNDADIAALHEKLKAWAGGSVFEELSNNLDPRDADGKLDLSYMPEHLDRMRRRIFAIPGDEDNSQIERRAAEWKPEEDKE